MPYLQQHARRLLGLITICLLAVTACSRPPELVAVTGADPIVGELQMRRGGSNAWARVRPETVLYVGDAVRAQQTTRIAFLDGAVVTLEPESILEIAALDVSRKALRLNAGAVSIETDHAQADIRIAESGLIVSASAGSVKITDGAEKHTVQAGQIAQLVPGQAIVIQDQQIAAAAPTATTAPSPSPTMILPTAISPAATMPASPTALPLRTRSLARPYLPLVMSASTPTPTRAPSATPTAPSRTPSAPPTAAPTALAIRVNCGGGTYRDKSGQIWAADQRYKEGGWGYVGGNIYTTGNAIGGTEDDPLYQSERWGDFFYLFDIPNGRYRVTLHFAEIYRDNPGVRKLTVRIEGHVVLQSLDLAAQVGRDVAYVRAFTVDLGDQQLGIEFLSELDLPKISAIAIEAIR